MNAIKKGQSDKHNCPLNKQTPRRCPINSIIYKVSCIGVATTCLGWYVSALMQMEVPTELIVFPLGIFGIGMAFGMEM